MSAAYKISLAAALIGLLLITMTTFKTPYSQVELVTSPFIYSFNVAGVLNESGSMTESSSPYWWLNSGGIMNISSNLGSTNLGEMPALSKWRLLYRLSNPEDTDNGYHPQNIFRLVSRNVWQNLSERAYFRIKKDNLSESSNRNISNGLLLMTRYEDHNNLYYAGLRVDGTAVIKKKRHGEYVTLAQKKIFAGEYHKDDKPNLLPKNQWLGLRTDVENNGGSVIIRLYLDENDLGIWKLVLEAVDTTHPLEGTPIFGKGFVGIRTDFMDVEFKNFQVLTL